MTFRGKIIVLSISFAIVTYAIVGGLMGTFAQQPINDPGAQLRIFESVLQHIQNDYVDEPNLSKVRDGALRGLTNDLDPYSTYLTADQVRDYQAKNKDTKVGIGAEFSQISSYLYVISVIKDSPADKGGLRAGDVIEYIENRATRDISLYDAKQMILGGNGTPVKLRVLRTGEKPQTITVSRGKYTIPKAESKVEDDKIGVIKVYSLEGGESADIKAQIQNLQKQGVQKIVLDLRNVSAGSLQEGVDTANLFIKDGTIAKVIGRSDQVTKTYDADPAKFVFDGKVSVLIDLGTAGAAEVIAGAFLDRKRGDVVGEKSFGAGTDQQLFSLRSGDGLLLTTAKWATPSGIAFLQDERVKSGVKPSVEVKRPETPEPLEVENLVENQKEEETEPQPNASPETKTAPKQPVLEDLQLKKALELLKAV